MNAVSNKCNNSGMIDLNDLRVFEKVAALRSFSAAAGALGLPVSTVSRSIARLEANLGVRLFQRTTRAVTLTASGEGLKERCSYIMSRISEAVDYAERFNAAPGGLLRISAGIGFGINVLAHQIPDFLVRYPGVSVSLELSDRSADLLGDGIDVAVRMGPMRDSGMIVSQVGRMQRYLCAAPSYLERRGIPATIDDVRSHDVIEMPVANGRPKCWTFTGDGKEAVIELDPRVRVNDPFTIYRMALNGAGLALIVGYLCGPEIAAGRLVRLLPEWEPPAVEVSLVFPSSRELSPTVRAFVDHMRTFIAPDQPWLHDPLRSVAQAKADQPAGRDMPAQSD